jgi:hypothetical protein
VGVGAGSGVGAGTIVGGATFEPAVSPPPQPVTNIPTKIVASSLEPLLQRFATSCDNNLHLVIIGTLQPCSRLWLIILAIEKIQFRCRLLDEFSEN